MHPCGLHPIALSTNKGTELKIKSFLASHKYHTVAMINMKATPFVSLEPSIKLAESIQFLM